MEDNIVSVNVSVRKGKSDNNVSIVPFGTAGNKSEIGALVITIKVYNRKILRERERERET